MKNKIFQGLIWTVMIYVIITWAYNTYYAYDLIASATGKWGFRTEIQPDSSGTFYLFSDVENDEFIGDRFPISGDTLLTINGETVNDSLAKLFFSRTYTSDTDTLDITVGTEYGHWPLLLQHSNRFNFGMFLPLILFGILPIPFFIVAIWAMVKQGKSNSIGVLTLLILSFAVFFSISLEGLAMGIKNTLNGLPASEMKDFTFHWYNIPNLIISTFGTGLWLHLTFLFPSPSKFIRKYPWAVYLLAYAIVLPTIYQLIFDPSQLANTNSGLNGQAISLKTILTTLFTFAQIIGGIVILFVRSNSTKSPLEKRQIKVLLQSVGSGILIITVSAIGIMLVSRRPDPPAVLITIILLFLLAGLMMIPLGFAYAFSRYRLMEVQGRLKQGMTFLLTTGGLTFFIFLLFFILVNITLKSFDIDSRSAGVFYALLIAMAYIPLHNILHKKIERVVYRTRYKMQEMLNSFLAISLSFTDKKSLWEMYGQRLKENIGVKSMHILFLDEKSHSFKNLDGATNYLPVDGMINEELNSRSNPLLIDEFKTRNDIVLRTEEEKWLKDNDILALVPIQLHGIPTGVMALEFEYGYNEIKAEELDLLVGMTNQVALQSENIGLLEERIEKHRLEEQLAMARKVQEQILPANLPETPGFLISAQCKFCLEVAGDMYDVIALSDGKTLVTIGDVSGKGAGAAMIMSNLQAVIRALAHENMSLKKIVKRANDELFKTTSSEQYITYFAAVIDSVAQTMTYVNAGHNSPILVKKDGESIRLGVGGMILGAVPFAEYEEATLPFEEDDLLVAFTDGISEAENEQEAMYGEEDLEELVIQHHEKQPDEVADIIINTIEEFQGSVPATDDITLVVIKKS